jgi:hypothetical protein
MKTRIFTLSLFLIAMTVSVSAQSTTDTTKRATFKPTGIKPAPMVIVQPQKTEQADTTVTNGKTQPATEQRKAEKKKIKKK